MSDIVERLRGLVGEFIGYKEADINEYLIEAAAEIERLRAVAQTAFGLLWQDRHTEARLHLSAALTKEQKGEGIAEARAIGEVKYKDLPIPPPVAKAVEALEHAAKHYQWLSDDEGDTGWVKYQAAAVMLDYWAAGIGEQR